MRRSRAGSLKGEINRESGMMILYISCCIIPQNPENRDNKSLNITPTFLFGVLLKDRGLVDHDRASFIPGCNTGLLHHVEDLSTA